MSAVTTREKKIEVIILRDDAPPESMNPRAYRQWLADLSDDDLAEWYRVVKKFHPKRDASPK